MVVHSGVHRPDQGDVIRDGSHVGYQLAHFDAALAMLGEFPWGPHHFPAGPRGIVIFHFAGKVLAIVLRQHGFRIEEIHVARAALHEHGNHRLRLAKGVGGFREIVKMLALAEPGVREQALLLEQQGEGDGAQPVIPGEELSAGKSWTSGWVFHGHSLRIPP